MYQLEKVKNLLKTYVLAQPIVQTRETKKCYIMMAADYGNVGDIAITIAQHKFLQTHLKNYEIIEVPLDKVYKYARDIRKKLNKKDIITIIGGGNSGDLYVSFEIARRFICNYFKNCNIISFPQTIDFSSTSYGQRELKKTKQAYQGSNAIFFAREEKSYRYYKSNLNNTVYLVPDIVLSLSFEENKNREGITICMRNDKEQSVNNKLKEKIIKYLKSKEEIFRFQDTHIGDKIIINKEEEFFKVINVFRNSKLVITDRLHGMIFCAITGTPCIAFNNSNKKVEYTYKKWLSNINNIIFISNFDEKKVYNAIDKLLNEKNYEILTKKLKNDYKPLEEILSKYGDDDEK